MAGISLCMIVKNEEKVLGRCLESAKRLADEIVIVDTGSEDRTREIARQYTSRVYEIPWRDDFSQARNFSFSKAEREYCMWLDADDVISEENLERMLEYKEQMDGTEDVVMVKYAVGFGGGRPPIPHLLPGADPQEQGGSAVERARPRGGNPGRKGGVLGRRRISPEGGPGGAGAESENLREDAGRRGRSLGQGICSTMAGELMYAGQIEVGGEGSAGVPGEGGWMGGE